MKQIIWGVRTMAKKKGVSRETIRYIMDIGKVKPSVLKKRGSMYHVFDEKEQNKIDKYLNTKKKVATKRPSS